MQERGKQIRIEGTDGTGKTTVANRIALRLQQEYGREVYRLDEPDSLKGNDGQPLVPIAAELRRIIKDSSLARSAFSNVLAMTIARRENWFQQSKVLLASGADIIATRDDTSTKVYQGFAEGVSIRAINRVTKLATDRQYRTPDIRLILDIDDEAERARRIAARGELETPDTFESQGYDFQQKVIEGYRYIARRERIPLVSAEGTPDEVFERVWSYVEPVYDPHHGRQIFL